MKLSNYIKDICPDAIGEVGGVFRCSLGGGCNQVGDDIVDHYICPCTGRAYTKEHLEAEFKQIDAVNKLRRIYNPKSDYRYDGINFFRGRKAIMIFESYPWEDEDKIKYNKKDVAKEMRELIDIGCTIEFNEDYGVGYIVKNDDNTFTVHKFVYGSETKPVDHGTLESCVDFIWAFCEMESRLGENDW